MFRVYSFRNWMFMLHRITGTALLVYFVAHVLTISTALIAGPQVFSTVMHAFTHPAFRALELTIVGCIAFHALNGLYIIAAERGWLRPRRDGYAGAIVVVTPVSGPSRQSPS